jgi:hypothetical protein
MRKPTNTATDTNELQIPEIHLTQITFPLLGTSPLLMNRLAEKARQELLLPRGRKNAAERKISLKHDPVSEFRSAMYLNQDSKSPTRLQMPARAFAKALCDTTADIPGAAKAQVGRLTKVIGFNVGIYGIPQLHMSPVRSGDQQRTPDIRTRAILERWAAYITVRFVVGLITERNLAHLVATAGLLIGVGDDRAQKPGGEHGQFEPVSPDDPRFAALVKNAGREAQDRAIREAVCYDAETEELFSWFQTEIVQREKQKELVISGNGAPAKTNRVNRHAAIAR